MVIYVITEEHKNYNKIYVKSNQNLVQIFKELQQQARIDYINSPQLNRKYREYKFHKTIYEIEEILYELTVTKVELEDFNGYSISE